MAEGGGAESAVGGGGQIANQQIVDMGDLSRSWLAYAPGQSGQLGSPHYDDLIAPWLRGDHQMLQLKIQPVGEYATNCYLLACPETGQALLVDPGADPDAVLAMCVGLRVTRILLTHGHFDHLLGLDVVRVALGVPVGAHPADADEFGIAADFALRDGMRLRIGRHVVRLVHVPGHTPGSVALRFDRRAVVGDAIFPGGPGHTDTPEALQTLLLSLQRTVFTWPDDTFLYPGHGSPTTVGSERPAFQEFLARPRSPDLCGDVTWQPAGGGKAE